MSEMCSRCHEAVEMTDGSNHCQPCRALFHLPDWEKNSAIYDKDENFKRICEEENR